MGVVPCRAVSCRVMPCSCCVIASFVSFRVCVKRHVNISVSNILTLTRPASNRVMFGFDAVKTLAIYIYIYLKMYIQLCI